MEISMLADTNVVSESFKMQPNPKVMEWLESQRDLNTSVITIEEMRFGELIMPNGKRRNRLHEMIDALINSYAGRILPFDSRAAEQCAIFHEQAISSGRTPSIEDLMIAAIAKVNNLVLVTRNTREFEYLDIEIINPFLEEKLVTE